MLKIWAKHLEGHTFKKFRYTLRRGYKMAGYTHTVTKLIEPDVLQLLQGLAGTERFDEMVKNPNSQENKLLAMVGAMAAHKNLTERLIGELGALLAVVDKTLGLRPQNTPKPTNAFDEEEGEEEIQQNDRARITRLTKQLELKQLELKDYLEKGKEQYQSCQQLLKRGAVTQISNVLDQELGGLGDDPAVADAIYDLYETRQQNKTSIVNKLGPQMPRSGIPQKALNQRLDQNFDVGTQVLLVGLLRNTAADANLHIELKSYLAATNKIDGLINLYAKVMSAVSTDYNEFLEKAESAEPQTAVALSKLQHAFEVRMSPQFATEGKTNEPESEESEQQKSTQSKFSGSF